MRRLLLAVGVIAATVGAPVPRVSAKAKPRAYVSIRRGQAPEVCAGRPDTAHPAPHWHDATFFFDLMGEAPREGDTLVVRVEGHPQATVTFGHLNSHTYTFVFPAGLGLHSIRAEWNRGPAIVAESSSSLGVYSCDAPSL